MQFSSLVPLESRYLMMQNKIFLQLCRKYHTISPMLNHPGCLMLAKGDGSKWLRDASKPQDLEKLQETWRSPKFIILAHILAKANELREKTLVYSKCLKTLNLMCKFLESRDWRRQIGSLTGKLGGWKKNEDYLRIDGSTESGKRGALVDTFNKNDSVRVFLISSIAGGIGINLVSPDRRHIYSVFGLGGASHSFTFPQTSATRVVIMDNHFNPTVSEQCVSRAHRYGQEKPVHCYRLAIEGTLETKVYKRSMNKSGVASGVIDGEYISQSYTSEELDDLCKIDCWATCSNCEKKRLIPTSK